MGGRTRYEKSVLDGAWLVIASNIYNWTTKKEYCDKHGIKYIHGVELYLTEKLYHTRMKVTENKDKTYHWDKVQTKFRDNYHIILLAKNFEGVKEINSLVSLANDDNHMYYKPRISFEEAANISSNVIICSACLASPCWSWQRIVKDYKSEIDSTTSEIEQLKLDKDKFIAELNGEVAVRKRKRKPEVVQADIQHCDDYIANLSKNIEFIKQDISDTEFVEGNDTWLWKLFNRYDYLEVQPHVNSNDQKEYNKWLLKMSEKYNKPIVCGTDTHSFDKYAAECRTIMQIAKDIKFLEEDTLDLALKIYDELVQMFTEQGVLTHEQILTALDNTNVIADSVEDFELDKTFKYPIFDTPENDAITFEKKCWEGLEEKIKCGVIDSNRTQEYVDRINEELRVFRKLNMSGFMLSMHYLVGKLRAEGIPFGFSRGSCGASVAAYVTDIIDCDGIIWDLSFERFCNENRVSLGDIDLDLASEDEPYILQCMSDTIGVNKVAHVFALGTNQALGAIDDIGRALARQWINKNGKSTRELKLRKREIQHSSLTKEERKNQIDEINEQIKTIDKFNERLNNPYSLKAISKIKSEFNTDADKCRKTHPDVFYYFDGIVDVKISASMHPAGNICADRTIDDNYGIMMNNGQRVIQLDMDAAHEVNLVKYDLLKLKSVSVLSNICKYLGQPYPRSYEVDWNDEAVWDDIAIDNLAIPQFESKQ